MKVTNEADETAVGVYPDVIFKFACKGGEGFITDTSCDEKVDIPAKESHTFKVTFLLSKEIVDYWGKEQEIWEPFDGKAGCFSLCPNVYGENASVDYSNFEELYVSMDYNKELTFGDVPNDAWFYDSVKYVYDNELMTGLMIQLLNRQKVLRVRSLR